MFEKSDVRALVEAGWSSEKYERGLMRIHEDRLLEFVSLDKGRLTYQAMRFVHSEGTNMPVSMCVMYREKGDGVFIDPIFTGNAVFQLRGVAGPDGPEIHVLAVSGEDFLAGKWDFPGCVESSSLMDQMLSAEPLFALSEEAWVEYLQSRGD